MDKKTQEKLADLKTQHATLAKRRDALIGLQGNRFEIEASNAYNIYAAFNNSIPGQPYIMTARNRGR